MTKEHKSRKITFKGIPSVVYFIYPSLNTRESWFLTDNQGKVLWAICPYAACGGGRGSGYKGSSGDNPFIYQNKQPVEISTKEAWNIIQQIK